MKKEQPKNTDEIKKSQFQRKDKKTTYISKKPSNETRDNNLFP
jgi:hypothetical protein